MLGAPCLADVCGGRDNNLNLIRMVAASMVIVSHAWIIAGGPETLQPLEAAFGYNLGQLGLFVFFAISGFLIARSFERQPSVRTWLIARFLRLFPALFVVLLLTVLVLGPLMTALPLAAYFSDPVTHSYILNNLSLAFRQPDLPGVFETLPLSHDVNGPLWTLWYEVLCYSAVLVIGLAGAFRSRLRLAAAAAIFVAVNVLVLTTPNEQVPRVLVLFLSLGLPFAIGVAFYVARRVLPLSFLLLAAMVAGAWAVHGTPLWRPAMTLTLCYGVFVLAYLPGGPIRRYNRLGDYSYGLYIYGWPVQMTMVQLFGPMDPLLNVALAFPIALLLAVASWTLVERPALAMVPHSDPVPQLAPAGQPAPLPAAPREAIKNPAGPAAP